MDSMNYSTSCAISDAFKSLKRYGAVTIMRVVGLALFVAGLFVVAKLAISIYVDATESQDQTTLRGLKISAGIESGCFTDESLESLRQRPEIENVERLYTILPTLLYQGVSNVSILESASEKDALFGKERMRVGRGPQASNETTLTKPLADRLGVKEEDVKKGKVVIVAVQERTRDGIKESTERQLNVVGVCRGTNEVGYVLETDAATMNAWASGVLKSMDGKTDCLVKGAFVYLREGDSTQLEEYVQRTKLVFKKHGVLKTPNLKTSTWALIDPTKIIDANTHMTYPTRVVNMANDVFVILSDDDPRLKYRETTSDVFETKNVSDCLSTRWEPEDEVRLPSENVDASHASDLHETTFEVRRVDASNLSYVSNNSFGVNCKDEENVELYRTPQKNVNGFDEWKHLIVKNDCDVPKTFGFQPEEKKLIRIVSESECKSILIGRQTTLENYLYKNGKSEEKHIYLDANVKENEIFYRRARLYDAVKPFTEQGSEELRIFEFDTTEETPKETSKNLVNDLQQLGTAFVKEKVETDATINGVPIRLIGSRKNDPENKLRLEKIEGSEDAKGLELSFQDAEALGAFEWKQGCEVPICFTRMLNFGKKQRIVLKFRFLGINDVNTKVPMEDLKNVVAWQRDELTYDEQKERFVDLEAMEKLRGSYSARVLAKSTDAAAKLVVDLTTMGYTITDSGVDKIEGTKALLKNLTSFVALFNISGLALCLLNIITTDFLVIRLRKNDVAAMIDLGTPRTQLFKEIFAETVVTASLALATVAALALTVGKPLAYSLLALTGVTISEFRLFDDVGVKILLGTGTLTFALASLAQISTIIFLARYKRTRRLRE